MVPEANTILNPRAMMIHLQHTLPTDAAVVAAVWLVVLAPLAKTPVSSRSLQLARGEAFGFSFLRTKLPLSLIRHSAWVGEDTARKADGDH